MNPERAFRFSSIFLATAGFTGLVLTGELPVLFVWLGYSAILLSLAQAAGAGADRLRFRLSRRAWNVLLVAAFGAFGADLLWISQDLLQAGIHFLILLMINKLLTLEQRKDFLHLHAISLLELLSAAALTVELWYAAVFVTYLLAAIWTLLLSHLRNEAEEVRASFPPAHRPDLVHTTGPITGRFFWTTNGITLGAFCLTLAIFFVTPRIGTGFFNKNRVERLRTSGFSEQVDLGVIGSVKLDQSVVMRVEFPDQKGPVAERLYFRGAAYDFYNGRSWTNSLTVRRPLERTADGAFLVPRPERPEGLGPGLRQDILLEALDTPILFGLPVVEALKGSFLLVQADGMGGLSLPYPPPSRFQYTIWSAQARLADGERTATAPTYPETVTDYFLQVPDMSPQVAELARAVTGGAATPFEKAVTLERHLRTGYRYSLDVGPTVPASPLEEFLFVRKSGYCEHYATAMVILLRTMGIPARLVTGFLAGEWNDFGRYYTIRQRDAHAWVEVYFPRSGWVTFDPTPSVAAPPSVPVWTAAGRVVDSIRLKWDRFIIRYSLRDQMAVAQGVRERSERARDQAWTLLASLVRWTAEARTRIGQPIRSPNWLLLAGLAAGSGALLLLIFVAVRAALRGRRQARDFPTARQTAVVRLYERMLQCVEARGLHKAPGATPWEFARLIAREWAEAGRFVEPLTALYCRVRFGQAPLSPDELRLAEDLLTGLRAVRHDA
ncbi:MAG: DUF3488 and transglutaminase-like domain-containing protein [Nitrospirota bacterium]